MRLITTYILVLLITIASEEAKATTSLNFPREAQASVGIVVRDLSTGSDVVAKNSNSLLTPASILKCVTAAAVMLEGKTEDKFPTSCTMQGHITANGTFYGDITVAGSGDPTLESENPDGCAHVIDSIAEAVKRLGITRIAGCLLPDSTYYGFREPGPVSKWEVEDLKYGYGAGLYTLNYRNNTCNGDRSLDEPVETFIDALEERLLRDSIAVEWNEFDLEVEPSKRFYEYRSPSFCNIMREMMVSSNNLYAEAMLRQLAPRGFRAEALERERQLLSDAGFDTDCLVAFDGSGLTRNNKITPQLMADLLQKMAAGEYAERYVGLFPLAGKEGTVKRLLHGTRLEGKLALKSGSMNGVQCFAGYKLDSDGKPTHAVVIMVNNFVCRRALVMKAISDFLLEQF